MQRRRRQQQQKAPPLGGRRRTKSAPGRVPPPRLSPYALAAAGKQHQPPNRRSTTPPAMEVQRQKPQRLKEKLERRRLSEAALIRDHYTMVSRTHRRSASEGRGRPRAKKQNHQPHRRPQKAATKKKQPQRSLSAPCLTARTRCPPGGHNYLPSCARGVFCLHCFLYCADEPVFACGSPYCGDIICRQCFARTPSELRQAARSAERACVHRWEETPYRHTPCFRCRAFQSIYQGLFECALCGEAVCEVCLGSAPVPAATVAAAQVLRSVPSSSPSSSSHASVSRQHRFPVHRFSPSLSPASPAPLPPPRISQEPYHDGEGADELAPGCSVVRNLRDWKWRDQDGGAGCRGTVRSVDRETGWVKVRWDTTNKVNSYRYGYEGKYDVLLRSVASASASPPPHPPQTPHPPTEPPSVVVMSVLRLLGPGIDEILLAPFTSSLHYLSSSGRALQHCIPSPGVFLWKGVPLPLGKTPEQLGMRMSPVNISMPAYPKEVVEIVEFVPTELAGPADLPHVVRPAPLDHLDDEDSSDRPLAFATPSSSSSLLLSPWTNRYLPELTNS